MDAFSQGLGAGIGAALGFALIDGPLKAQPTAGQQVVWADEVNGTTLMVMQLSCRTNSGFHLYAITPANQCVFLGARVGARNAHV